MRGYFRWGIGIALIAIALDQLTKWWVMSILMQPPQVISFTPFSNLVLAWNRGISFGLFNTDGALGSWIFSGIAIAIVAILGVWLWRVRRPDLAISIGMIMGGALGNVIDRLRLGAVVDFLDLHISGFHWPAFNLADSFITIGALYLIIESFFAGKDSSLTADSDEA